MGRSAPSSRHLAVFHQRAGVSAQGMAAGRRANIGGTASAARPARRSGGSFLQAGGQHYGAGRLFGMSGAAL